MHYDNKLGIFGNLKKLYTEANKTNAKVFNTNEATNRLKETEALTLELAADHEARICEMELGVK